MKSLNDINDWTDVQEHQLIGEILMQSGILSLNALGMALDIQKIEPIRLGDILLNIKVISKDDLNKALSLQKQIDDLLERTGVDDAF